MSKTPRRTKPANESKRDAFVRIGEKRMKVLIKGIRSLGNLSNRNAYEFAPADIATMVGALLEEVEEFRLRMENRKRSLGFSFRLDEESDEGEQKAA